MPEEKDKDDFTEANSYNDDGISEPVSIPRDITQEHIPPLRPQISKKTVLRKIVLLVVILICIVAVGVLAWKFIPSKNASSKPQQNKNQTGAASANSQSPGGGYWRYYAE